MIVLLWGCLLGLLSGFLLMIRVRDCNSVPATEGEPTKLPRDSVVVIVPARNEEKNLPRLLGSIPSLSELSEVVVVDDGSTDRTGYVATSFHARVIAPGTASQGFTGKTWACAAGASQTTAGILFFLDADTFFRRDGCRTVLRVFGELDDQTALSILPFAVTERLYEDFSLFFNLLMAFGAGSFGVFSTSRLVGQSMILSRDLYDAVGGHTIVKHHVLENFHLAKELKTVKSRSLCLAGRGALEMRMFPEGFAQLWHGWMKSFAAGAGSTDPHILVVSIVWLTSLVTIVVLLLIASSYLRSVVFLLYLGAAAQIAYFARQIGTFRILSCLLFPIPLLFFFILFSQSAFRRATHRTTKWRGRNV